MSNETDYQKMEQVRQALTTEILDVRRVILRLITVDPDDDCAIAEHIRSLSVADLRKLSLVAVFGYTILVKAIEEESLKG